MELTGGIKCTGVNTFSRQGPKLKEVWYLGENRVVLNVDDAKP